MEKSPESDNENSKKTVKQKSSKKRFGLSDSFSTAHLLARAGEVRLYEVEGLNEKDIEIAKEILKPGDVVLVGTIGTMSHEQIGGPVTHAMFYLQEGVFLHSARDGVEKINQDVVFKKYQTMAILRPKEDYNAEDLTSFALSQQGKPYDTRFEMDDDDAFYCTELVARSLEEAGQKINLPPVEPIGILRIDGIHPKHFLESDLEIKFMSHNLNKNKEGKVEYTGYKKLLKPE